MASESFRQFEVGPTLPKEHIPTVVPPELLQGAVKCSDGRCKYVNHLDWFAVDFLEEYSALDSGILEDQTEFIVTAIDKVGTTSKPQ
jgi:hypothetical protein